MTDISAHECDNIVQYSPRLLVASHKALLLASLQPLPFDFLENIIPVDSIEASLWPGARRQLRHLASQYINCYASIHITLCSLSTTQSARSTLDR